MQKESLDSMRKESILILFGADSKLEWGRSFQLARAFKQLGHHVMYIDLPLPITQMLTKRDDSIDSGSRYGFPIFRPKYGLPSGKVLWLRRFNREIIFTQIVKALNKEQFNPTIIWIYSPYEPEIAKRLRNKFKPRVTLYDCADDRGYHAELRGGKKERVIISRLEWDLIAFCDVVITVTDTLKELKLPLHQRIEVVPNGIDPEMFSTTKKYVKPMEYFEFKNRVILYVGSIEDWVDIDLLVRCADEYPDFSFVFIGSEMVDTTVLREKNNIIFLGKRNFQSLPSYIYYSDLCLIPFKNIDRIKYSNTLKALQYISLGKPVLATFYDRINVYEGLITVAYSQDEFIKQIRTILESEKQSYPSELRQKIINDYSWEHLAQKALRFIE